MGLAHFRVDWVAPPEIAPIIISGNMAMDKPASRCRTSTPATARGASGATIRNPHGMQAIASSGFPHAFWPQPEQVNFVFELGAFCSLGRCALSRLSLQFVAASRS